jgi:hypothetical protein
LLSAGVWLGMALFDLWVKVWPTHLVIGFAAALGWYWRRA